MTLPGLHGRLSETPGDEGLDPGWYVVNQADAFDSSLFGELKRAEEKHFWFQVRRKWIFDVLRKFIAPPAKMLEIGCGTGNVSSFLSRKGYDVTGCEYYREAIERAWPGVRIVQGDARSLPFDDNFFDIVGLFDVIEHFEDDVIPLKEAARVCRKEGIIAVTVPAGEELWSWFDEASSHKRRYSAAGLKRIFSEARLEPSLMEYMFLSLLLPAKYRRGKKRTKDLFKIHPLVNLVFMGLGDLERCASRVFPLPAGTSLIAVARKKDSGSV